MDTIADVRHAIRQFRRKPLLAATAILTLGAWASAPPPRRSRSRGECCGGRSPSPRPTGWWRSGRRTNATPSESQRGLVRRLPRVARPEAGVDHPPPRLPQPEPDGRGRSGTPVRRRAVGRLLRDARRPPARSAATVRRTDGRQRSLGRTARTRIPQPRPLRPPLRAVRLGDRRTDHRAERRRDDGHRGAAFGFPLRVSNEARDRRLGAARRHARGARCAAVARPLRRRPSEAGRDAGRRAGEAVGGDGAAGRGVSGLEPRVGRPDGAAREQIAGGARTPLVVLLAAGVCLLLIVCANLGSCCWRRVRRGTGDGGRAAIGASGARLQRQLLTGDAWTCLAARPVPAHERVSTGVERRRAVLARLREAGPRLAVRQPALERVSGSPRLAPLRRTASQRRLRLRDEPTGTHLTGGPRELALSDALYAALRITRGTRRDTSQRGDHERVGGRWHATRC